MPLDLRRLFAAALKASVAGPLAFSCGTGGVDTSAFEPLSCENTSDISIAQISPAGSVDYAELRHIFIGDSTSAWRKASSFGTRCGGASNMATCSSALDAVRHSMGFGRQCGQVCSDMYIATSTGDVVAGVATLEALKAFLGTIDTPQEAVLLVATQSFDLSCTEKSRGAVRKTATGFEVIASTGVACGEGTAVKQHLLAVGSDGTVTEVSQTVLEKGKGSCAIGRRPCGLVAVTTYAPGPLAAFFTTVAHLEAASVPAFHRLHDELSLHGAPPELRLAARLSAADEVRHARAMSAMARRFGGRPVAPRVRPMPLRPLADVALDNAVEGCVRETYGALVAQRQALKAKDAGIAAELAAIAVDETRHAELSWQVHGWAMQRLPRRDRRAIEAAQQKAARELVAECAAPVDAAVVEQAGMPDADEAVTLARALAPLLS
ncbi:MAG: ferritin-like domain-containing protein [Myxococcaceae bacterium]|nr:ferritin-like domain-containing protein [Myxococcaceae bacterium]